jgi:hypothetical protein
LGASAGGVFAVPDAPAFRVVVRVLVFLVTVSRLSGSRRGGSELQP